MLGQTRVPRQSADDNATNVKAQRFWYTLLDVLFTLIYLSVLALLTMVVALSLYTTFVSQTNLNHFTKTRILSSSSKPPSQSAITLNQVLSIVTAALEDEHVMYWLLPGLQLLPPSIQTTSKILKGKLSPHREGVHIAVPQKHIMSVALALSKMQQPLIKAVESHYGLRLFPESGHQKPLYDYCTPFVDIIYFKEQKDRYVSNCCDCKPVPTGPCSKKTCDCLVCVVHMHHLLPLTYINIEGVESALRAPRNVSELFLSNMTNLLHPSQNSLHV